MPYRGNPDRNPTRIPVRNPDGTVNVSCRRCGVIICKTIHAGYSTATCYYCETGTPRPKFEQNPQEELLMQIFASEAEEGSIEKLTRPKKKFNLLDMMINTVTALGFKRKVEEPIAMEEVKYPTIDEESSKQVAKRKRREPIFSKMKKE